MLWILEASYPDHLREVVDSIEKGDEDRAAESTRRYYHRVDVHLSKLLQLGLRTSAPSAARPESTTATSLPRDGSPAANGHG